MKIFILIPCFLISGLFGLKAQTIGLRTGLSIASQVWKAESGKIKPGTVLGSHVGLTINHGESEKISGQFEVSFSQFGFGRYSDSSGSVGPLKLNYIKLGCAIKYHVKENLNIHFGPELGFAFNTLSDLAGLPLPDFGAFAGIEYYFTQTVGIGGRYFVGFSDVNDNPNIKQLNRAFQFSILLRINGRQLKELGY